MINFPMLNIVAIFLPYSGEDLFLSLHALYNHGGYAFSWNNNLGNKSVWSTHILRPVCCLPCIRCKGNDCFILYCNIYVPRKCYLTNLSGACSCIHARERQTCCGWMHQMRLDTGSWPHLDLFMPCVTEGRYFLY